MKIILTEDDGAVLKEFERKEWDESCLVVKWMDMYFLFFSSDGEGEMTYAKIEIEVL